MRKVLIAYLTLVVVSVAIPVAYWYETKDRELVFHVDRHRTDKFFRRLEDAYYEFLKNRRLLPPQWDVSLVGTANAGPAPTLLVITPTTECTITGVEGGPFIPTQCSWSVTSTRAWANFSVQGRPAWMNAVTTSNRTPATITYNLNTSSLPVGIYEATITFNNLSAPQAPLTRAIKLTVIPKAPPPPAPATWSMTVAAAPLQYSKVDDTVTWQYVLTNTGTTPITNIQVWSLKEGETMPVGVACPYTSLGQPAMQMICSNVFRVTEADILSGAMVNTVTAKSNEAPDITQTKSVNYMPPSDLGYLLDNAGQPLCTDQTCVDKLLAK